MVEKEWEEIKEPESIWRAEAVGDEISGKYIAKEEDVGIYHSKKYTLETSDGEIDVFGSVGLDDKFKEIPLGYEVKIVYQGEKPSKPPKKAFKVFQVFKRPANDETAEDKVEDSNEEEKEVFMNPDDDPGARDLINDITNAMIEEHRDPKTPEDILKEAKEWHIKGKGINPDMLGRIEKQLKRRN